jgi:hypothetical protein
MAKFEKAVDTPMWTTPDQKEVDVKKFNTAIAKSIGHFEEFVLLFRGTGVPLRTEHFVLEYPY